MESGEGNLTSQRSEHLHFMGIKNKLDLPSVAAAKGNLATQFSVGEEYWSQVHKDPDLFLAYLSALSARPHGHNEDYLCYPEYKLKISLETY